MNEAEEHLVDDIERLSHHDANLEHGFVVHLHRLSEPGAMFSNRDWSPNSPRIITWDQIVWLTIDKPVEVFYGLYDSTGQHPSGVWIIKDGNVEDI
jgi:hypothetical protein